MEGDLDRAIITAGFTNCESKDNIVCGHAYTIISAHTVQDPAGNDIRLLKIRNPWGDEEYRGNWSDNWSDWTPEFLAQLPEVHQSANDGLFYIDMDSYIHNFGETRINLDTSGWNLKWFLMKDDPAEEANNTYECDFVTTCTKHQIRITNNGADQVFHVGGHVW